MYIKIFCTTAKGMNALRNWTNEETSLNCHLFPFTIHMKNSRWGGRYIGST